MTRQFYSCEFGCTFDHNIADFVCKATGVTVSKVGKLDLEPIEPAKEPEGRSNGDIEAEPKS